MVYLDLEELPSLVGEGGLIKHRKIATNSFLRTDHLFDPNQPLAEEVRQLVKHQTGTLPNGPIRLLTQLRCFGYYFSPLNLFYVHDQHDERVECVVAEVSNTPWNERHCYTLGEGNRTGAANSLSFSHAKAFHVSPFMGMDMEYRWTLSQPGIDLKVQLANVQDEREIFCAGMTLKRRDLTKRQLTRMTLQYPLMTAQIGVAIYLQALKLWWKKCPFYTHPNKRSNLPNAIPESSTLPTSPTESRENQATEKVR
jgi:DUF1365 family protein